MSEDRNTWSTICNAGRHLKQKTGCKARGKLKKKDYVCQCPCHEENNN